MTERPSLPPLKEIADLDGRWLAYVERTRAVFANHPRLVPLRQPIFKAYVNRHSPLTRTDRLKHWARFILRRAHSTGDLTPTDVVFWLDSPREVLVEPQLAVLAHCQALGLRVTLIVVDHIRASLADLPSVPLVTFRSPYRLPVPTAWKQGWSALRAALPDDLDETCFAAYWIDATTAASIDHEMKRLLAILRPKLLVCSVDQLLPGSAVCSAAHDCGVPSLVLLHGAVSPYNAPVTADRMCVWGQVSFEQLTALGVPPEQLIITGSPRHDRFPIQPAAKSRQQFKALFGLSDKPYFVFFSNGNDPVRNSVEALEGCARWLDVAARQLGDQFEFLVRLHPNENGDLYRPYPQLRVFKSECDLDTTLGAADVCAALCSTTLSDALIYEKPVLQFYADGWRELADNWQRGLAERIASPEQLVDLLASDHWRSLARQQADHGSTVFSAHGHASATVSAYIKEQVSR